MLAELTLEYDFGRTEVRVVPIEESTIYPKKEGIRHASCRPFKYEVPKHNYLCVAIVKFGDRYVIMPSGIECHPKTTLNDIKEIESTEQIRVEKELKQPKKEEKKSWKFESASGGGTYFVTQTPKGLKCNCSGFWRVKDREKGCKHMQEVRKNMGSL